MAAEQGVTVDEEGFRALMKQQRDRARADARAKKTGAVDVLAYRRLLAEHGPTDWRAYDTLRTDSRVLGRLRPRTRTAGGRRAGRDHPRGARPHALLRRVRRPGRRRGQPRPGTAAAPRCSTCSGRSRAWSPTRCASSRASCARAPSSSPRSTASGGSRPARRTRARTWCTRRCARCSARRRCSPAPTTGPATCGWTSPGRARSPRSSAPTSRTSPTRPSAPTTGSPRAT